MTEEESRKILFQLNLEYMSHPPKERVKLYDEYIKNRAQIHEELFKAKMEKEENEIKTK